MECTNKNQTLAKHAMRLGFGKAECPLDQNTYTSSVTVMWAGRPVRGSAQQGDLEALPLGRLVQPWPTGRVTHSEASRLCLHRKIESFARSYETQTDFCKSNSDLVTFKIYKMRAYLAHSQNIRQVCIIRYYTFQKPGLKKSFD